MTSKAAIFALLTLWGVGTVCLPAAAQDTSAPASESSADSDDLTDRVWVKAGDAEALPGVIKIFLSDGTLVQDSCWETHRLSAWTKAGDNVVSWNEDGIEIKAAIVTLSANELVLKVAGMDEERYTPATVPYVCPDVPKG
jgi:hypothetical protein